MLELHIVGAPDWDIEAECRPLVAEWESRLSRFVADSDVSRLQQAAGEWVVVAPITDDVLISAVEARKATGGAFDVLATAFVSDEQDYDRANCDRLDLCLDSESGLDPNPKSDPNLAQTQPTEAHSDPDIRPPLERREGRSWRLAAGCPLDLGGIAKGIVTERLCDLASRRGASGALVNFGSSSVTCFGKGGSDDWQVALRAPGHDRRKAIGYLPLPDGFSLSVSGFAERGRHIVDPFTSRPSTSDIACAAVAAPRAAVAESWSTALLVLGSDALPELANRFPETKVVAVTADRLISTPGWFLPL
jgi:thiamine biosynthesis lipoprotein